MAYLLIAGCWALATGQSAPADSADPPAEGRRLLEDVKDGVFSFDDPAFYWFCRYVDSHEIEAKANDAPVAWTTLAERPSDFRGQLVTIEGVVQSLAAHDVTNRPDVPRLYQLQLSNRASSQLCTLVVTKDPGEVPMRSLVRARGYFIKIRGFRTKGGDEGAGPLVVAASLAEVRAPAGPTLTLHEYRLPTWLVGGVAAMALIWFVLRRRLSPIGRGGGKALVRSNKTTQTDRDFDWLDEIDPDTRDLGGRE